MCSINIILVIKSAFAERGTRENGCIFFILYINVTHIVNKINISCYYFCTGLRIFRYFQVSPLIKNIFVPHLAIVMLNMT